MLLLEAQYYSPYLILEQMVFYVGAGAIIPR